MTCRTVSLNNLPSINPFQIQETTPWSGFVSENLRHMFFTKCYYPPVRPHGVTGHVSLPSRLTATTLQSVSAWQAGSWVRTADQFSLSKRTSYAASHHCVCCFKTGYIRRNFLLFGVPEDVFPGANGPVAQSIPNPRMWQSTALSLLGIP